MGASLACSRRHRFPVSSCVCRPARSTICHTSRGRPWMNSAPSSTGAFVREGCTVQMRPPTRLRASRMVTRRPVSQSACAHASPATPAPITTTSVIRLDMPYPQPKKSVLDEVSCLEYPFPGLVFQVRHREAGWRRYGWSITQMGLPRLRQPGSSRAARHKPCCGDFGLPWRHPEPLSREH